MKWWYVMAHPMLRPAPDYVFIIIYWKPIIILLIGGLVRTFKQETYLQRMFNSTRTVTLLPLLVVTLYVPPSEMRALSITKVELLEITFPDCDSLDQVMLGFGSPVILHEMMACSPRLKLTFFGHWRVGCTAILTRSKSLVHWIVIDIQC